MDVRPPSKKRIVRADYSAPPYTRPTAHSPRSTPPLRPPASPSDPQASQRTVSSAHSIHINLQLRKPSLRLRAKFRRLGLWQKVGILASLALLLFSIVIPDLSQHLFIKTYALSTAEKTLLPKEDSSLAKKIVRNQQGLRYDFNANATTAVSIGDHAFGSSGSMISASFPDDPSKEVTVNDPINNISFGLTPKFNVGSANKDSSHVFYPFNNGDGTLVYSPQASSLKEDVILTKTTSATLSFDYAISMDVGLVPKIQKDGSIGVYGADLPSLANVSTGTEKDRTLLENAKKNAAKTKLIFTIPAPFVKETNRTKSIVKAAFSLLNNNKTLRLTAQNLNKANYPLTLDPTVSVASVAYLYRNTNAESNVDFNPANASIARGQVTGGVIPAWTANANSLASSRFLASSAISNGYIYVGGGAGVNTTTNFSTIEYAQIATSAPYTIGAWRSTTALPVALSKYKMLSYNGFIYAIGGSTGTTTCSVNTAAVYVNATLPNGALSSTWTNLSGTPLPAALCSMDAAVYNGKIYVAGGQTGSSSTTAASTLYYATILPDGSLSAWSTDDSTLPVATYGLNLRIYNGYVYLIGGIIDSAGNPATNVNTYYAPLANDGSIYGTGTASWIAATALTTARTNMGSGSFAEPIDGFMYVSGGCSTVNANQSCTAVRNDTQIAQINADGSLGPWTVIGAASHSEVGGSLLVWQKTLYSVAGCSAMNAATVSCQNAGTTLATQQYSAIGSAGELGPKTTGRALPTAVYAHGVAIYNGFMYIVGGCIYASATNSCQLNGQTNTTGTVSYAALSADGSVGTWTNDTTNVLNGTGATGGLAAMGLVAYNGYLYASGGYNRSGNKNKVYAVALNPNGSLVGAWATSTFNLPNTSYYQSLVAERGNLYVIGGCSAPTGSAGCSTYYSNVSRITLTATGALPAAISAQTALPLARGAMAAATYNGYIYLAGGADGTSGQNNTVTYAKIQQNGSITSWSTATGRMPNPLRRADAYAANGYLYVFGGHNGLGPTTYANIVIGKIDLATGNIPSLANSVSLITPRWDVRAAFSNGQLYVTGGCSTGNPAAGCSGISNAVEYFEFFNADNLGTGLWTNSTNTYATNVLGASSVATNGYIYNVGGCNNYNFGQRKCVGSSSNTDYAALNPDGSVGAWNTGPALPTGTVFGCMVSINNRLYYIAGSPRNSNEINSIFYSTLGANGLPGAWSTMTNSLPLNLQQMGCDSYAGTIYVVGGVSSGTNQSATYYLRPSSSTGDSTAAWSTAGATLGVGISGNSVVSAGGFLYTIGGNAGTTYYNDVQYTSLDPATGATGATWVATKSLPGKIGQSAAVVANGYIYVFGGQSSSTICVNTTYIASINSSGELGEWTQGINNFTTARTSPTASFYNGYYYVMGGDDCTNIFTTNVVQYGGQQSQAMKTFFTRYSDLGGDAAPRKFVAYVTNAQNSGVDIEYWKVAYQTSTQANNSYGISTSIFPIVSQTVYPVTAYDGTGTDVKLDRYIQLAFSISMEKSFSFTDDTQPSINSYFLYYSPATVNRLRNGKNFQDQQQQGFDLNL